MWTGHMFDGQVRGRSQRDAGHAVDLRLHLGLPSRKISDMPLSPMPSSALDPCLPIVHFIYKATSTDSPLPPPTFSSSFDVTVTLLLFLHKDHNSILNQSE
ncbi:hypothetical protein O3P69_004016 [Scylla paramamosain]|uniref:Uncharacterized protein n=1 Tax=Scylla paramamosain TaxID=85552 RepID=A0AAW0UGY8_SCYPA